MSDTPGYVYGLPIGLGVPTLLLILYCVISSLVARAKRNKWRDIARKKIQERNRIITDEKLPESGLSPKMKEEVLNNDVTTLRKLLDEGKVTSKQILLAYYERARTIGVQYEWITETNFAEALQKAEECDKLAKDTSIPKGPLFGIPISIKDFFDQASFDSTFGLASRCFNPAKEDSLLVRILKESGAIPFVRSNVPQAAYHIESNNFVFGDSKNPYDKTRTTGGSSGGEAGLVSARCSPIGLGTDTVGSLRMPPLWCGVVGFKATPGRISLKGHAILHELLVGQKNIMGSVGGITKSVNDANLLMKTIITGRQRELGAFSGDPTVVNTEWKEEESYAKGRKFRVGYVKSFNIFQASDTCVRAVEESVQALKKRGHETVEIHIPDFQAIVDTTYALLLAEGDSKVLIDCLKGEKAIGAYGELLAAVSLPRFLRRVVAGLLSCFGEKLASTIVRHLNGKSSRELMILGYKQQQLYNNFLKLWEENKLDALILPGTPTPAPKLYMSKDLSSVSCYCMMHGLFNLPGGVLPITRVKEEEAHYTKRSLNSRQKHEEVLGRSIAGSAGLPVGVQFAALPFEDEKMMAIMREIEEEVAFRSNNSFPL